MTEKSEGLWASMPPPYKIIQQAAILMGRARALIAVGIALLFYGFGLVSGVRVSSYRGQVADADYAEQRIRLVNLERFVQAQFPKALLITGRQAAVVMDSKERARRESHNVNRREPGEE